MTRVTGRVSLPYGRSQPTTPVCGHVRYVWVGGVADQGEQVLIPGVAVARIIDGVVEDINLSPGRWLPVLVVDDRRYDLPEIIVEASDVPAPTPPSPEPEPTPTPTPAPPSPEPEPMPPAPVPEPVPVPPTPTPEPEPVPVPPVPTPTPEPEPVPVPPVPTPTPEPVPPTPAPVQPLGDGGYAVPAATVRTVSDGGYAVEFEGARWAITHTGEGNYEMKES